jgi:hypothetical protein
VRAVADELAKHRCSYDGRRHPRATRATALRSCCGVNGGAEADAAGPSSWKSSEGQATDNDATTTNDDGAGIIDDDTAVNPSIAVSALVGVALDRFGYAPDDWGRRRREALRGDGAFGAGQRAVGGGIDAFEYGGGPPSWWWWRSEEERSDDTTAEQQPPRAAMAGVFGGDDEECLAQADPELFGRFTSPLTTDLLAQSPSMQQQPHRHRDEDEGATSKEIAALVQAAADAIGAAGANAGSWV